MIELLAKSGLSGSEMIIKIKRHCGCNRISYGSSHMCSRCFGEGYVEEVIKIIDFEIMD